MRYFASGALKIHSLISFSSSEKKACVIRTELSDVAARYEASIRRPRWLDKNDIEEFYQERFNQVLEPYCEIFQAY